MTGITYQDIRFGLWWGVSYLDTDTLQDAGKLFGGGQVCVISKKGKPPGLGPITQGNAAENRPPFERPPNPSHCQPGQQSVDNVDKYIF